MKWLLSGNRARLVLAIALSVVAYLFAGALMFTSGYMISLAATIPLTVLALHLPSIFVRIFGIGKPPLQYAYRLASHDWVLRMTSRLRLCLYDALRTRTSAMQSSEKTGRVLSMLTDDIGHAQDIVLRGVLPIALAWLLSILIVTFSGFLSPVLAAFMLMVLVVSCIIVPMMASSANTKEMRELKQESDALYAVLTDNVSGIVDWAISGRRDHFIKTQSTMFAKKSELDRRIRSRRRICELVVQCLFCLCVVALIVWAAATFAPALQGSSVASAISSPTPFTKWIEDVTAINASPYPANWIAAFALCFFPLMEALSQVEVSSETVRQQNASVEELIRYMGPSASVRPEDINDLAKKGFDGASLKGLAETPDIEIADLAFSYGDTPVIKGLDLTIPYGEKLAITGESGIGKTTLAMLVHGDCKPLKGFVRIGGIDACTLAECMHRRIGVVGQFPYLFDMSLRDNLLIAKPSAKDEELYHALELVGLKDMLDGLPDGLSTRMMERGMRFSGGERHRIALARIFLADTPIVLLDEPFANLDKDTENDILEVIFEIFASKTVIVISHHRNSLDRFDRIIEL